MSPIISKDAPIRAGIFAYSTTALQQIKLLVSQAGVEGIIDFASYDITTPDTIDCELAIVYYDRNRDIEDYKNELALLKVVRGVSIVILLAMESQRPLIEEHKADLSVDDIQFLPLNPAQFGKTIKTYTAAIKIARERRAARGGFSKNKPMSLGEILVQNGVINPLELKKALEHQKGSKHKRLGDVLVDLGYIDVEQKLHFLSSQLGVPLATTRQYAAAEMTAVSMIPEHIAKRYTCIALEKNDNELLVAMTDVMNLQLLDILRDTTEMSIKPCFGSLADITGTIERCYRDISSNRDATNLMANLGDNLEFFQQKEEDENAEELEHAGEEVGIVKLVNMIFSNAVQDHASDIHIEPQEKELTIRYRVDGDLQKVMSPPKHSHQAIIARIKILSNLDIAERRLPQDGRMVIRMGKREVDIRVSILPTIFGEKAVMRILDKESFQKNTSNLGFADRDMEVFADQIKRPYGMIIVTGPTGSGKSTTLYSALQRVKSVTTNIVTVEDPVEFHMEGVTQVQANNRIGLTFAAAMRSFLRQDPDIVLIGEIRDNETADIAIKMALTGHLVFSTLHTNDAASTIARFVDIGIPPLLLASSLNLIIAQRLLRKICPQCKVAYEPPVEMLEQLNIPVEERKMPFYRGEGCVNCNSTGYKGRTGIFEMLPLTKDIRTLILRNSNTAEIQALAEKEGMRTLRRSGIELSLKGETTLEQVLAATMER